MKLYILGIYQIDAYSVDEIPKNYFLIKFLSNSPLSHPSKKKIIERNYLLSKVR